MRSILLGLGMGLILTTFSLSAQADEAKKGPPFATGPGEKKLPPKPKVRDWTVKNGSFAFSFSFEPGIPDTNKVVEVTFTAAEIPKTPHPRYGNSVPLINADLVLEFRSPAGQTIARYLAHPMPLTKGKYGFHFTATEDGVHSLVLTGKTKQGTALSAEVKVPVNVWPLPKELEGTRDASVRTSRRVIRRPVSK